MKIVLQNISFRYKTPGTSELFALQDINLTFDAGEFVALVGASGSGKTTLMQHFTALLKPDRGAVLVDGENLSHRGVDVTAIRRRIGLAFQFPEAQLFESTVYDDVAFAPRSLGLTAQDVEERVRDAMQQVELDFDRFKERSPFRLSEGEKRRVALAGILAMRPECLALDEPTAGLDAAGTRAVIRCLKRLHRQGRTVVLISHNLDLVAALARRIVVLKEGRVVYDGPRGELFRRHELLRGANLRVPRIVRLAQRLREAGWLDDHEVYSADELKARLRKRLVDAA